MFDKLRSRFSCPAAPTGPVEFLIVGLGNPGAQYERTRHNAGYLALDYIAGCLGVPVKRIRFKSLCGEAVLAGRRVLLLKPTTFMNRSGEAIRDAMAFYKLPIERVLVLYDDVSLPQGRMRVRRKGSDGGHNGIRNILYLTGEDAFPRVKIGIGAKAHPDMDLVDWVIGRFTPAETKALEPVWDQVMQAAELIVGERIDEAMNRFN